MKDVDNVEFLKQRNLYIKVIVMMTIVGVVAGVCGNYYQYSYDGGEIDIWRIVLDAIVSILLLIKAMLYFMAPGYGVCVILNEIFGKDWFIKLLDFSDIKRGESSKEKFITFAKISCRVISLLAIFGALLIVLVGFMLKFEGVEDY